MWEKKKQKNSEQESKWTNLRLALKGRTAGVDLKFFHSLKFEG